MIRYIRTKIRNKYKLYLCLLLGIISIVMSFSMIVVFRDGSDRRLIQRGFSEQRGETGEYPARLKRSGDLRDAELMELGEEKSVTAFVDETMDAIEEPWNQRLRLPVVSSQRAAYYRNLEAVYSYGGLARLDLGYLDSTGPEPFSDHYVIKEGAAPGGDISEYTKEGVSIPADAVPCVVGQTLADTLNLVVGELISFYKLSYKEEASEKPKLTLYVSAIISEKDGDYFWGRTLDEFGYLLIVDKAFFEDFAKKYPRDIYFDQYASYDYRYITTQNVDAVDRGARSLAEEDKELSENLTPVIRRFRENSLSVSQMLYVIVLPLVILVIVFIGMISFRIIDSEQGELTTLRNRGLSKGRLTGLYLLQSLILALIGLPPGIAAGFFFGRFVAGVDDFCGFHFGDGSVSVRDYQFTLPMLYAGLIGAAFAVVMMMIPVFLFFGKKRSRRKAYATPFVERYFIDVILLAISCYLLFNYNKQVPALSEGVLNGEGIDPVIFINSTFFLFACGMLMLRLIFYLVRLILWLGEKRYSPMAYAGLIQILRTRKSSGVITVFLVMTVAMSIFNAGLARTINANKEARLKYENGADLRIEEHWDIALVKRGDTMDWKYHEPDYAAYQELKDRGDFEHNTRVILTDRVLITSGRESNAGTTLMGIHTKEFGETAELADGMTEEHWYNYLNRLAAAPEGAIISKNLAEEYGLKNGSRFTCEMLPPKVTGASAAFAKAELTVVSIVDSWPGYLKYQYGTDEKGKTQSRDNYLIVMNYGTVVDHFAALPYEVWARTGLDAQEAKERLETVYGTDKRYLKSITSWRDDLKQEKSSAIMQITNGIFTADFLITLLLCVIGYMIFWITSVRDRELLFGIYRAMGISRGEINRMIGLEQIFLSVMSIFAGTLAGSLALRLFVKVFAAVYLPEKHNVAVFLSSQTKDLLQIGAVLLVVIVICVLWIRRIVKKLNITEALKLGDD